MIVATGGLPDTDWLEGAEHCTTVWDVLAEPGSAKDDVLVYDGIGRHQAVSCALHLAEQGRAVQFVTLDDMVGAGNGVQSPASSTASASPATACARFIDHSLVARAAAAATGSPPPSATN